MARRHWLAAPIEGRARFRRRPGDDVPSGELIAEVVNGRQREPIIAPADGMLAIVLTYGWVAATAPAAVLFEDVTDGSR